MSRNQERDKAKLLSHLENAPMISLACIKAGISRATFYRWRKDDPEFSREVELAQESGTDNISDLAESKIVSKISNGDFAAIKLWLAAHRGPYMPHKAVDRLSPAEAEYSALIEQQRAGLKAFFDDTDDGAYDVK